MEARIKAFCYCRVSGLTQCGEDKDGFRRQSEAVASFAAGAGYDLLAIWPERGVSGKNDETQRPVFSAMLAEILSNGVRHVLVESLSRLAREYRIQEQLLIYLAKKDVHLISCDTGENITEAVKSDPMKKAMIQMQGIFFELERSLLVKKLADARRRKRQAGIRCDGAKPYGTHPGEAEAIARIKELRASGMTFEKTAMRMNEMGYRSRRGRWHPTFIRRVLDRG